jgi:hypothetical protein
LSSMFFFILDTSFTLPPLDGWLCFLNLPRVCAHRLAGPATSDETRTGGAPMETNASMDTVAAVGMHAMGFEGIAALSLDSTRAAMLPD